MVSSNFSTSRDNIKIETTNETYYIIKEAKSFSDAKQAAEDDGAKLASFETENEYTLLYNAISSEYASDSSWGVNTVGAGDGVYLRIGGTDGDTVSRYDSETWNWKWISDNSEISKSRVEWGEGTVGEEPDNYFDGTNGSNLGGQDSLAMGLTGWGGSNRDAYGDAGEWNDVRDDRLLYYLVEVPKAPTISSFDADNSVVWTTSNIVLNFSEAVDVESGNIVIYKASDDSVVETIDVTSLNKFSVDLQIYDYSSNTLALLGRTFLPEISSYLGISEDSEWYEAKTHNEWYQELKNNWKMTINGTDYLFVDSSNPQGNESLNAQSSGGGSWVYVSTNEEYTPNVGGSGSTIAATFTNLESKTSYTINPTNYLEVLTSYYLQIDATAFDDSSSNSYPGISDKTTLSFTTVSDLEAYNYIASYEDLINAFGLDTSAAVAHYHNYGKAEGRSISLFSAEDYLAKYSDLAAAYGNEGIAALMHYIQYGYAEGRTDDLTESGSGSGSSGSWSLTDFEALNYIASYGDLISAFGTDITSAKSHYTNNGESEGRDLDDFDEWGYLASNNDLMGVFGSDTTEAVTHYIQYGFSEGRSTNTFNADSYLNNYADLKNAFGNDLTLATKHYVESGFNEGRFF